MNYFFFKTPSQETEMCKIWRVMVGGTWHGGGAGRPSGGPHCRGGDLMVQPTTPGASPSAAAGRQGPDTQGDGGSDGARAAATAQFTGRGTESQMQSLRRGDT